MGRVIHVNFFQNVENIYSRTAGELAGMETSHSNVDTVDSTRHIRWARKMHAEKKNGPHIRIRRMKDDKNREKKNPDAIHVSGVMTTNAYMMLNQPYVCVETHEPIVTGIPFRPQMSLSLSFISYRIIVAQNTTCKNGNNATGYKGMLCSTLFFQQIENRRHCFYCRCACCIRTYASANGCPHQTNTISQRLIRS